MTDLFRYINSLEREYDDSEKIVRSVTFNTGRYGDNSHTIFFDAGCVTEKEAIEEVEQYLSQPLTETYYEKLRKDGDLFGSGAPWVEASEYMKIRCDCIGDARFLESIEGREALILHCGS